MSASGVTLPASLGLDDSAGRVDEGFLESLRSDPDTFRSLSSDEKVDAYRKAGAQIGDGVVLGFGTYGPFRAWPAYKYTVEHSVYVHRDHRGRGHGRTLLGALIDRARAQGYHTLVAGIEASNTPSLALHREFGFHPCGVIRHAGYKFGRWLDLEFHQLVFDGPRNPTEG